MRVALSHFEIKQYLDEVDKYFDPPLSSYTNVHDYSKKLSKYAETFCWFERERLIGLVAMYCNTLETRKAFITSVSVHPDFRKKGIAKKLLREAIKFASEKEFKEISLEVFNNTRGAIRLYNSLCFKTINKNNKLTTMKLELGK